MMLETADLQEISVNFLPRLDLTLC
jgi:hypothetical protein